RGHRAHHGQDRNPHLSLARRAAGGDRRRRSNPQTDRRSYLGRSDARLDRAGPRGPGRGRDHCRHRARWSRARPAFPPFVGRPDPKATVASTAIEELGEETGYTAERVERLGDFYASPGMLSEGFAVVRAHGVRKVGSGGGDENEDIKVHLVGRGEVANFIE